MVWRLEIASNKDATAWTDITSIVDWTTMRFGGTANRGEIDTGSGFDLADDAAASTIPKRRRVRLIEDATTPDTTMWQGRTVGDEIARGTRFDGNARQFDISLVDVNADFGGIDTLNNNRPAETDIARIQSFFDTYWGSGQTRPSTVFGGTYFSAVSPSNLAKHTYTAVQFIDLMTDITDTTGKQFFLTKDYELFYAPVTSTIYAAGLSITDDGTANGTTSFAPGDASANVDATEMFTGVRVRYSGGRVVRVVRGAVETANDQWRTSIVDESVTTLATATARADRFLDEFDHERITYRCYIDLLDTQVNLISWGMTVSYRSAASGLTSPTTLRVARCSWERIANATTNARWRAHLELGYPTKFGRAKTQPGSGNPGIVVPPVTPFVPGTGGMVLQYKVGGYASTPTAATVTLDTPATAGNLLIVAISAEDDSGLRTLATGGYTLQATATNHSGFGNLRVYTKTAAGGEATVSDTGTAGKGRIVIVEVQGTLDDVSEVDDGSSALTTFTANTLNPATTGVRGVVFGFFDVNYQDYNVGTLSPVGSIVEKDESYSGVGRLVSWFGFKEVTSLATSYAPAVLSTVRPADNEASNTWASVALIVSGIGADVAVPSFGQTVNETATGDGTTGAGSPTSYAYLSGTLQIWVNGVEMTASINEVNPEAGTFTFDGAPPVGAEIVIRYKAGNA